MRRQRNMSQIKEQNKITVKELNETDNMLDKKFKVKKKKFKVIVIKMLNGPEKRHHQV